MTLARFRGLFSRCTYTWSNHAGSVHPDQEHRRTHLQLAVRQGRRWLLCHRGELQTDPVPERVRDGEVQEVVHGEGILPGLLTPYPLTGVFFFLYLTMDILYGY